MNGYYYFNFGVTHWVVQIISIDRETGQAICRIDRVLEERWKRTRFNRCKLAQWRHTQPGQGEEIELPLDMLRPCHRNMRLRAPIVKQEPVNWGYLILAACIAIPLLIIVWGGGVSSGQDAETVRLLANESRDCAEAASQSKFAHRKLGKDWMKWSRYYYKTGRSDDQLVVDCNFCGGPQLKASADTDFEYLDRIEAEQN